MNVGLPSTAFRSCGPALVLLLLSLGCGGGDRLQEVRGKVLYKDQPAKGVVVIFHPTGGNLVTVDRPTGRTGEDGTFTLSTGPKQGAPAGEYTVTFLWPQEVAPRKKKGMAMTADVDTQDRLKGAYADAKTSQFKVQIRPGESQLEPFRLK